MSWKEVTAVAERKRFMELWEQEGRPSVAQLCREFDISRKTGYKWISRYRLHGEAGLQELPRASHTHPNAISDEIEELVIQARHAHPSWGAKKLLPWLQRKHPRRRDWPCVASVSSILERNQLVRARKRRRLVEPFAGQLTQAERPNDLWCIDHKGWWMATNGDKCEPFTVTDHASRYLIRCALRRGKGIDYVRPVLNAAFCEYGLPLAIRSDNGPPFASRAPLGLSELSVWFLRLGICHERIEAGNPQQNGRHERMHLTMQIDKGPGQASSLGAEQKRLNAWREEFNTQRPHEALGLATPHECYLASPRAMPRRLPELEYSSTMRVRKIDISGKLCWRGRDVFVTEALRGQQLGLEPTNHDGLWTLWFGRMILGIFDERRLHIRWAKHPKLGQAD